MYAQILNLRLRRFKQDDPQKKRKHKYVLRMPAEKLLGWQEVVMDLDKIGASIDATRKPNPEG